MEVMAAMDANGTRWNDDRHDEFARTVNGRFDEMDHELARVNDRLDDLIKVLIGGIIAFTAASLSGFIAMAVVIATQN
jgi:hypothetical protein